MRPLLVRKVADAIRLADQAEVPVTLKWYEGGATLQYIEELEARVAGLESRLELEMDTKGFLEEA